jgi:hypothetical protein
MRGNRVGSRHQSFLLPSLLTSAQIHAIISPQPFAGCSSALDPGVLDPLQIILSCYTGVGVLFLMRNFFWGKLGDVGWGEGDLEDEFLRE